jgi:VanZ family protein
MNHLPESGLRPAWLRATLFRVSATLRKKEFEAFILWTVLVLALLLAPIGEFKEHMPGGFRHWDKLAHVALFGITGVVSAFGAVFVARARNRILFALVFGLGLAIATEAAQRYIGGRTGSFFDLLSDVAGLSFALLLYALWRLR